ncbi:hypothetical protein Tco_0680712 [Tanacetum coccineum]|uniref:CCHC-type domain-containing protein n=1 Tax=Tanacetum coccineum TaxID=301880 RepID=A0ABQ4XLC3_9ASTR
MPPKRTAITVPTTPMTDAANRAAPIAQGVADALLERDADRSRNGDDSHDSGNGMRRQVFVARECTYIDFLKCQPLNIKGTEGVVVLTQWLEKIEYVFHISNCTVACQIKFATCTLLRNALTWWNSYAEIKSWKWKCGIKLKWYRLDCPQSYNQRFQELALMCGRMFPEESDEDAIKFATKLMDQKIHTLAERQAENKRKFDDNNQTQQQPPKMQSVAIAYTVRNPVNNQRTLTCYECGNQGHYRSECSELKDQNHGNQAEGTEARGMVYSLGGGETNQDLNNMEDDINV